MRPTLLVDGLELVMVRPKVIDQSLHISKHVVAQHCKVSGLLMLNARGCELAGAPSRLAAQVAKPRAGSASKENQIKPLRS